ncbi:hypothetical protein [Pseudomonas sp. YuFO8]|uniref:hypothetical protein n=1 Tax=Pseudomonas sp. YuFO8 TaxID=3095361 RepID=UPI002B251BC8|nr:hypothetical protein [Pseudomonas sp. YuFO8]MEB2621401.1 hypothetical protein [Pseudomonas sp. YuFO8]
MGIKLISNNTLAPWNSKVVPPVSRGLEGWFNFDTDAGRFGCNRALGKPDANIIGAPVAFATHGRFKGLSNYLQTKIAETDEVTLIVVGKAAAAIPAGASTTGDANTPFYVGNYRGNSVTPGVTGSAYGASLYHVATASLTGGAARENGTGGATSSVNSVLGEVPTEWGIRVLRASSAMYTKTQNLTKNLMSQGNDLRARALSDSLFRIGSGTAAFGAEVDISAVIIHSVVLTDDELAKQVEIARKRMARLGIVV